MTLYVHALDQRGCRRCHAGDIKSYSKKSFVQHRSRYETHPGIRSVDRFMLPFSAAHAQFGNLLKQGSSDGASGSGGLGNLSGMGGALTGQSLTSGSTGNVAGVLQFCIKNNYLSGGSASSVENSLTSKLSGGSPSSDSGYADGAKGILKSSSGQQVDLSGGGLKQEATKQVCDKILAQGKSMLGDGEFSPTRTAARASSRTA